MKVTRSGAVTAGLVVVALFSGSLLAELPPGVDDVANAPFAHGAELGETVTIRTMTVTAHEVSSAKLVESRGTVADTTGIWLIVDVTLDARGESRVLPEAWRRIVASDGRTFGSGQALSGDCGTLQPGLPTRCQFAWEMPADALAGATLEIWAENPDEADDVAVINLDITDDEAAALAAETRHHVLAQPVTGEGA